MITDMTKGNALKLVLLFSLPILIGNVFQQLYHIADIFIVGRLLGENALAAVGASAPINFMFLIIAFSFTGGLTAVTAQRFGAGDLDGVRRSVTHSIRASLVLSLILTAILVTYLDWFMHILNVPASIYKDSYNFIMILSLATVLIVAFNLLSGFIRALGDSKTPLYFLILSTVLLGTSDPLESLWLMMDPLIMFTSEPFKTLLTSNANGFTPSKRLLPIMEMLPVVAKMALGLQLVGCK